MAMVELATLSPIHLQLTTRGFIKFSFPGCHYRSLVDYRRPDSFARRFSRLAYRGWRSFDRRLLTLLGFNKDYGASVTTPLFDYTVPVKLGMHRPVFFFAPT